MVNKQPEPPPGRLGGGAGASSRLKPLAPSSLSNFGDTCPAKRALQKSSTAPEVVCGVLLHAGVQRRPERGVLRPVGRRTAADSTGRTDEASNASFPPPSPRRGREPTPRGIHPSSRFTPGQNSSIFRERRKKIEPG